MFTQSSIHYNFIIFIIILSRPPRLTISSLSNLCKSIGLHLLSVIDRDTLNALTNDPTTPGPLGSSLGVCSSNQLEARSMLHQTFQALLVALDTILVCVLPFSIVNFDSSPQRRSGPVRVKMPSLRQSSSMGHPSLNSRRPNKSLRTSNTAVNKSPLSLLSSLLSSADSTFIKSEIVGIDSLKTGRSMKKDPDRNKFTDILNLRYFNVELQNLYLRTDSFRGYRYPELSELVERVIICGSGVGADIDGIWNAGLLLRLSIIQLLNSRPHLALSALTTCQFIAEVKTESSEAQT